MDDFEYSVEICDRDWECFLTECEECTLLPPSLAGVDDSGMSEIDEAGSIFAKRVQKVEPSTGLLEADRPLSAPPDCRASPGDHNLYKHSGGIESILSGSEEDIHLQSINIFFEKLKHVPEADPKGVGTGKYSEATQEEKWCDGQQASANSPPARGETGIGKETVKPVDTIRNINKAKRDKAGSNNHSEPEASELVIKTDKPALPEMRLLIREGADTANEATQRNQSHDTPEGVIYSETTPQTNNATRIEMRSPLEEVMQDGLLTFSKKCIADSLGNIENVKWKGEQSPVFQSEEASANKTECPESSPSASLKRRRRRKRRPSADQAESGRQVSGKQSDSEEEKSAWRKGTGLCVSEDLHLSYLNDPQKNVMSSLTTFSAISKLPAKISEEIKVKSLSLCCHPYDSQHQYLPESAAGQGRCKATGLAQNNATNDRSVTWLSQADDSVMPVHNNSGHVATDLMPSRELQVKELSVLNEHPGLPVSVMKGVTFKLDTATGNHAGILQSDKLNNVITCENEQNPSTAKVKSIIRGTSPSPESNDPAVEISQTDKLSVLAVLAGNPGRGNHTQCQREAELQQQLETDCHYTDRYSSTLEKIHFPLSATGMSSCDSHNTKPKELETRASSSTEAISSQVDCAKLTVDAKNSSPDKCCQIESPFSFDPSITAQLREHDHERAASQMAALQHGHPFLSREIDLTGKSQSDTKSSMSENTQKSASDISFISSCCTLDTESVMSLSNENITDMSESCCVSAGQNVSMDHREKTSQEVTKYEAEDCASSPKSESVASHTGDLKCVLFDAEDAVTASKAQCEPEKFPDSKPSVFAMSSFWSEMEKLTINDILGLRMISKAVPLSSLPPLEEGEEIDTLSMTDSGIFTQLDELKPEQNIEDISSHTVDSSSCSGNAEVPCSLRGVLWDSEPAPLRAEVYPENIMLTSFSDISQPVIPGTAQTCLRRMSKNVSVHNLHALESNSLSDIWKGQTLQTLNERELENVEGFANEELSQQDKNGICSDSSSTDSFSISLSDIFQYLFGEKQPTPNQPATDNITPCYTDGNSVPETYDHFFSEFDTESFFYQAEDELVPIFSCTRSANRNLQFPEAYDHFYASSSSDESSDDEDDWGPVRVVSRFTHTQSASNIFTDIYENFFTESDLKQNFFWKNTFSFRNSFIGSTVQKQTFLDPLPLTPVRKSGRSVPKTVYPVNVLGNQDVMITDQLLYNLDDRIAKHLAQPFRYEDFQTALSNPRLDASLLPLRQSDMCLVCIAVASWVLKTANPQVGDAWKAVLLANVSALSAIRYLRKYVKMEEAASEKKLHHSVSSDS